jgi:transposase
MHDEQLSYRQVAALFDIRKFNIVGDWERRYDEGGENALSRQPKRVGSHRKMPKPTLPAQSQPPDDESRTRDELIAELNQLRLENDYLKKLDALVQKKRSAQQKKRKS